MILTFHKMMKSAVNHNFTYINYLCIRDDELTLESSLQLPLVSTSFFDTASILRIEGMRHVALMCKGVPFNVYILWADSGRIEVRRIVKIVNEKLYKTSPEKWCLRKWEDSLVVSHSSKPYLVKIDFLF